MNLYDIAEVYIEVAWQTAEKFSDRQRADARSHVINIADDIMNLGLIDEDTENIEEVIASYLESTYITKGKR